MCEELRKRRVNVCCMQEVRCKGNELVLWILRDKGVNYVGQEMMQDLEGLESW